MNIVAEAKFPTGNGEFKIISFTHEGMEHVALVRGEVGGKEEVPIRIHSQCLTGDTLGSMRCDCRQQLAKSMEYLGKQECGVLVYLMQEGRGIGLANKIKAYCLQDEGHDTVDANEKLGFKADERNYSAAVEIINALGVKSINILTNNPDKVRQIEQGKVKIAKRTPVIVEPTRCSEKYLSAKKKRMGHYL